MRFHIDSDPSRCFVKIGFCLAAWHQRIAADDIGVSRARQYFKEPLRPRAIRGNDFFSVPNAGRNDPIAGNKVWCQTAGNSKTDDARRPLRNGRLQGLAETRRLHAQHRHTRALRDAGLKCQAGNGDDAPFTRHPFPYSFLFTIYPKADPDGQRQYIAGNTENWGFFALSLRTVLCGPRNQAMP
jgi:hypothetical protein